MSVTGGVGGVGKGDEWGACFCPLQSDSDNRIRPS